MAILFEQKNKNLENIYDIGFCWLSVLGLTAL